MEEDGAHLLRTERDSRGMRDSVPLLETERHQTSLRDRGTVHLSQEWRDIVPFFGTVGTMCLSEMVGCCASFEDKEMPQCLLRTE